MISIVVPAHNEEACLGRTLQAIHEAAHLSGRPYEIIVANDASTDGTTAIALMNNARVVTVNHRQIAATRNSGARAARGEYLFFVDADTIVNPRLIFVALQTMDKGAVGGGAPARLLKNEIVPLYGRLVFALNVVVSRLVGFIGGAFMFCTRKAFDTTGGFNESLYCSEEGPFVLALKREGRFVVLWEAVETSGRRFRTTTGLQVLTFVIRVTLSPRKMITRRSSVQKIWYESNRREDYKMPSSWAVKISNSLMLLIFLVLLTGPLWVLVPNSSGPLGEIKLVMGTFLCHVGLLLWPLVLILLINLMRQKRWTGWIQTTLLIAFCSWHAWGSTRGVIWFWPWFYHKVHLLL